MSSNNTWSTLLAHSQECTTYTSSQTLSEVGLLLETAENRACGRSYDLTLPGEFLQAASSRPELQALTGLPPSGPLAYTKSQSHRFTFPRAPSSRNDLLLFLAPCLSLVLFSLSPVCATSCPVLASSSLNLSQYTARLFHYHLAPSCSTLLSSPTSGATAGPHQDGKA